MAYVYGLPKAAIAMCRAVLEIILKQFYLSADDGQQGEDDLNLAELIVLAERRYRRLEQLKLHQLRKRANEILHDYTESGPSSDDIDQTVHQFLETIKTLIEQTPVRARGGRVDG